MSAPTLSLKDIQAAVLSLPLEERRGMSRCEIVTQSIKQLTRVEISTALLWSLPRDGKGPHRRERLY